MNGRCLVGLPRDRGPTNGASPVFWALLGIPYSLFAGQCDRVVSRWLLFYG